MTQTNFVSSTEELALRPMIVIRRILINVRIFERKEISYFKPKITSNAFNYLSSASKGLSYSIISIIFRTSLFVSYDYFVITVKDCVVK